MAKIRTIKPDFFLSATLARVSLAAERTFAGLWTQADDHGVLRYQPAVLNGALWPERGDHSVADMRADVDALCEVGVVCLYEAGGKDYLHLPSWAEHQKVNHPAKSKHPVCPAHTAVEDQPRLGGPGELPLEGEPSGKSVPQCQQEGAASVQSSGAAVPETSEPGDGDTPNVAGVTQESEDFCDPSEALETAISGAGEAVAAEDPARTPNESAEGTFSQVSGLRETEAASVTQESEFYRKEKEKEGKGRERTPSGLRPLVPRAHAREARAAAPNGSQPTTASTAGGTATRSKPKADQPDPQPRAKAKPKAKPRAKAKSGPRTADALTPTTPTAASEDQEEATMAVDENQDALLGLDLPEPEPKPEPQKRARNKNMTEERMAQAKAILNPWWDRYGKGRAQSYRIVLGVIVSVLANGMSEADLKTALLVLGDSGKPISSGTIQFALAQAAKGQSASALHAEQEARRDPNYYKVAL